MFIIKHKNRRSDRVRNPHFFHVGGDSKTDSAGAVVMDLEFAAEVMEGVFADNIKRVHAEAVASATVEPVKPTIWTTYKRPRTNLGRSLPLDVAAADLLDRRAADRGGVDRRNDLAQAS